MSNRILAKGGSVLGITLLVVAAVVPWLQLSSSILGGGAHNYSPWNSVVTGIADGMAPDAYLYFLLTAAILFNTARWIRRNDSRTAARNKVWLLLCSIAMLVLTGVTLIFLPSGLALVYPYYDVTLDTGGLLAIGGSLIIIMSVVVGF